MSHPIQNVAARDFALEQADANLPDPPDNFDLWNSFDEEFRDRIANQFKRGMDHEFGLIRERVQREYAVARERQAERDAARAQPKRPRGGRGRR